VEVDLVIEADEKPGVERSGRPRYRGGVPLSIGEIHGRAGKS